jgi:hypothetical protein
VSWCDKLASTPSMGFGLEPHYSPSSLMLEAIAPLLDPQTRGEQKTFSLDRQDTFELVFTVKEGFQYTLTPTRVVSAFVHRMEVKQQSAGTPVATLISELKPYTALLPEISDRLVEVTSLIPNIDKRKLLLVGVISTTVVFEEEMPPGIKSIIKYYTEPWGSVESYTLQIIASLDETDQFRDRCIHTIVKSDDEEAIPMITLDWQRKFKKTQWAVKKNLDDAARQGKDAALLYFEQVAEGVRFRG